MGNDISRTSDILLVALIAMDVVDNSFYSVLGKRNRSGNIKRDRETVVESIENWTDKMFQRQFRLSRVVFMELLSKLNEKYLVQ